MGYSYYGEQTTTPEGTNMLRVLFVVCAAQTNLEKIHEQFQSILNEESAAYGNIGLQAAYTGSEGMTTVAAGWSERKGRTPTTVWDQFGVGSVTKTTTAAWVFRCIEDGKFSLDDPVPSVIDAGLEKANGTRLEDLWGPQINRVTIRMLLQMRSGIHDYLSLESKDIQLLTPNPPTPYDILHSMPSYQFMFPPGTSGDYSNTNYILLGLAVAYHNNMDWDQLQQGDILPRRTGAMYPTSVFPHTGSYRQNGVNMSHGYTEDGFDATNSGVIGWTAGNWLCNALDLAQYYQDLWNNRLVVSKASLAAMSFMGYIREIDFQYGMANILIVPDVLRRHGYVNGHLGDTYGWNSVAGASSTHNFSVAFTRNGPRPSTLNYTTFTRLVEAVWGVVEQAEL
eukprot:TRINITY_DN2009_c0_g2_i1.p2 TRINITY_DN2009_c0_g2~~TRINITY_DN2009_c0_g2_i1.p2  ORF type:complete len:395 (+),score=137.95 TRINITY_DN2009_c0_g2_i1:1778-2962(+)